MIDDKDARIAALEAQLAEVRRKIQERADWHKCSCPHPCDDYNVFPGGCSGKYRQDYISILSALEATPPAPMVTEDRPTHCGGCGETEPAKRCIGCLADFGPASLHQQETADDAMAGAAVHAIREMLNEIGVPQATFIDDHVRNGLVWARQQALEEAAQVADDEAEIERSLTRREAAQSADYIAQRIRELIDAKEQGGDA